MVVTASLGRMTHALRPAGSPPAPARPVRTMHSRLSVLRAASKFQTPVRLGPNTRGKDASAMVSPIGIHTESKQNVFADLYIAVPQGYATSFSTATSADGTAVTARSAPDAAKTAIPLSAATVSV